MEPIASLLSWGNISNQQNVLYKELNAINSEILKISENEIAWVLSFGKKVLWKIWILGLLHPQFASLKTVKDLLNHFLLERNLFNNASWQ